MTDYSAKRFNAYSEEELIGLLREFVATTGLKFVPYRAFSEKTGISESTIERHFGSWTEFCRRANFSSRYQRKTDRTELFSNLDLVWQTLGRQPRAKEMKQPLSPISISRYSKEFRKSWHEICLEFLEWKCAETTQNTENKPAKSPYLKQELRVRRSIPLSTRYDVLKRDRFRCVKCGRSPATNIGVILHVDHIVAHSKGGQARIENFQTLCSECNLGKSNR